MVFWIGSLSFATFLTLMFWPVGVLFLIGAIVIGLLRNYGARIERREANRGVGLDRYMR